MRKNGTAQIYTDIYNRLSLSFIDGHNESETNGELTTEKIDRKVIRRVYSNPRDENDIASIITTQDATPQDHRSNLQQNHACAITKTVGRIYVAKQHKGTSGLESETCEGKSRGIDRVEELCRV
jgi:hypothetical protein